MSTAARKDAWDAGDYGRNARFVSAYGSAVVEWLAPQPGEVILDLGCGDGALTAEIASAGATVTGADASESMVAAARARGINAQVVDGQALPFSGEFDAVFTNAALHWMPDAGAVVDGARRALKPGGRFAGEFGGKANVAAIQTALIAVALRNGWDDPYWTPWYFPSVDEYRAVLEARGFTVRRIALIPRPTPIAAGMAAWLETLAAPFFLRRPEEERAAYRDAVVDLLKPALCDGHGNWTADYMRLRFDAVL